MSLHYYAYISLKHTKTEIKGLLRYTKVLNIILMVTCFLQPIDAFIHALEA